MEGGGGDKGGRENKAEKNVTAIMGLENNRLERFHRKEIWRKKAPKRSRIVWKI